MKLAIIISATALAGQAQAASSDLTANKIARNAESVVVTHYPRQMEAALHAVSVRLIRCSLASAVLATGTLGEAKKQAWAFRIHVYSKAAGDLYPYDKSKYKEEMDREEATIRGRDVTEIFLLVRNCSALEDPDSAKAAVDDFVTDAEKRVP